MLRLAEALLGWLVIVGMVFGGAGVLLLVLSTIRSLGLLALARRVGMAPQETTQGLAARSHEATSH